MTLRALGGRTAFEPTALILGGSFVATVAAAGALAWAPQLTMGVLVGLVLLAATVRWPFGVVTVILVLGPFDFSFMTGGFKALFENVGGLDMNGIRLVSVSAGLLIAVLADRGHHAALKTAPVLAYAAFLAWAGATLAFSPDVLEGLRLWFKLLWPLLVFLIVSGPQRDPVDLERVTDWILLGSVVVLATAPLYVLAGDVQVDLSGAVRLQGAGTHQNPFSFYLLVIVLLCLGRLAVRRNGWYLALATAATVWIGLTQTRITVLAGVAVLFVVGAHWAVVKRDVRAGVVAGALGLAALAAAAPTVLIRTFGEVPTLTRLLSLAQDPLAAFAAVNWSGREVLWAALVAAWAGSPWIGLGLGASSEVIASSFLDDIAGVAHNEYLRLGTDTGVVGLVLGAVVGLIWARRAAANVGPTDAARYELFFPALGVLVAAAVISLTDNTIDYYTPFTQYAGFLTAGCVVASRGREK